MDDSKTISSEVSIKDNFIKKNLWRVCLSKFLNELHKSFYKKSLVFTVLWNKHFIIKK